MVDFSFFYSIILLLFLQEFFDPLFFKKVGGVGGTNATARSAGNREREEWQRSKFLRAGMRAKEISSTATGETHDLPSRSARTLFAF